MVSVHLRRLALLCFCSRKNTASRHLISKVVSCYAPKPRFYSTSSVELIKTENVKIKEIFMIILTGYVRILDLAHRAAIFEFR